MCHQVVKRYTRLSGGERKSTTLPRSTHKGQFFLQVLKMVLKCRNHSAHQTHLYPVKDLKKNLHTSKRTIKNFQNR